MYPIDSDTINRMNMMELKNELKLRQLSIYGAKYKLKERLMKALDKKLPKYTDESLVARSRSFYVLISKYITGTDRL
jgi:hypothetical protein